MSNFPLTRDQVKTWIANTVGQDETDVVREIHQKIDQYNIDGKMLLLLYKYPREFPIMLPIRSRLLFVNALDVLVKSTSKDVTMSVIGSDIPSQSLQFRMAADSYLAQLPTNSSQKDGRLTQPDPSWQLENSGRFDVSVDDERHRVIPLPVPLPVFDHAMQQAIDAGRLKERCIRSRLANACARFYVNIKLYPTQMDYNNICEGLVNRYPSLRDPSPKNLNQPWSQLKKLLSMAFCNLRRTMKTRDIVNAKHIIGTIQKRYRGSSRNKGWSSMSGGNLPAPNRMSEEFESSDSDNPSSTECSSQQEALPNPPPLPTINSELSRAVSLGKLKERPWASLFYRRCASFYTRLKSYPSRHDYRNISNHLATIFRDLGHPSHVKHMLSQYIRSYRQSRKLWKLDRQQKKRTLTLELSGKKGFFPSAYGRNGVNFGAGQSMPGSGFYNTESNDNRSCIEKSFPVSSPSTGSSNLSNDVKSTLSCSPDPTSKSSGSVLSFPVPLPPMDESMLAGIRDGHLQDKNLKGRFIRLCAGFYIGLKRHPTKEEYNNICRTIVTQFPELQDPVPLPGCPPFMLFKKAMTACIRNKRRDPPSPRQAATVGWPASASTCEGREQSAHTLDRSNTWVHSGLSPRHSVSHAYVQCSGAASDALPSFSGALPSTALPNGVCGFPYQPQTLNGGVVDGLPYPLPLPTFGSELTMLLDTGQPIVGEAREAFFRTCTRFYSALNPSPNRANIAAICANLAQAFPQLASDADGTVGRLGFTNGCS